MAGGTATLLPSPVFLGEVSCCQIRLWVCRRSGALGRRAMVATRSGWALSSWTRKFLDLVLRGCSAPFQFVRGPKAIPVLQNQNHTSDFKPRSLLGLGLGSFPKWLCHYRYHEKFWQHGMCCLVLLLLCNISGNVKLTIINRVAVIRQPWVACWTLGRFNLPLPPSYYFEIGGRHGRHRKGVP